MARISKTVSSWWFTALTSLVYAAFYISFTSGEKPFGRWVYFLFHSVPGVFLCIASAANLIAISVRRIKSGVKDIRGAGKDALLDRIGSMDASFTIRRQWLDIEGLQDWLILKGFRPAVFPGGISAIRYRSSFIPGLFVRTGIVILVASLFLSSYARKTEDRLLHRGDTSVFMGRHVVLSALRSGMPDSFLEVGEKSAFKLSGITAELSSSSGKVRIAAGLPVTSGGVYFRIVDFGWTLPLTLRGGGAEYRLMPDMPLFPPGRAATETLPSGERVTFSLWPERTFTKGLLTGRQYNLASPLYRIALQPAGEGRREEADVKAGGRVVLDGREFSAGRPVEFIRVQAVRDPGLPGIYGGLVLILLGLLLMPLRFFWYERRILAVSYGDYLYIGHSEEFFKKWGVRKFHLWKKELQSHFGQDRDG